MGVEVDKQRTTYIVEKALVAMDGRQGLFSEGVFRPEEMFIEVVKSHGERVGKPEFAPNAVFLTTAFVFGDDTTRLFKRITDPDGVSEYAWIFDPKEAGKKRDEVIINGCAEFFRPAGYNRRVVLEWPYNLRLLEQKYGGDVRNFFDKYNGDMEEIVRAMVVRPRAKTEEKREKEAFTRYGPKIAPLVVQWMNQYDLYKFRNSNGGGLPVDFQVARVLIQTGAVILDKPENAHQVTTNVGKSLGLMISEHGWEPRRVSESLWNVGNRGCNQKRHSDCPLQDECDRLISRKPYDKDGKFDPKDTGRWE
ncbi:MAG TPA: hypothetical protein VI819_00220 [Patescibacteria group bacterium]|nr:hypothetical protein [Patescibacteria group bacterium]